ncbi:flippase-like domain-containing protein [Candidatus Micrarchaeota archaeon]|nr:flippase-like domain-containing protein [Candidatus Micrarchaeota archaeon]
MQNTRWYAVSIAVIFLLLVFALSYLDVGQVVQVLFKADLLLVLVAIVLEIFSLILKTFKWQVLLNEVKKVKFLDVFKVQLAGIAISNLTPARIGETTKAFYMEKHGFKKRFTLLTILWERLFDLIALIAFSALIVSGYGSVITALLLLSVALILLTHKVNVVIKFVSRFSKFSFLSEFNLHKFRKRVLLQSLLLSLGSWFFSLLAVATAFRATGIVLPFETVMGAFAISLIVGTISTLPGGFGSLEATLYLLLHGTYALPMLVAAFITARIVTIGLAFALGGLSLLFLHKPRK